MMPDTRVRMLECNEIKNSKTKNKETDRNPRNSLSSTLLIKNAKANNANSNADEPKNKSQKPIKNFVKKF